MKNLCISLALIGAIAFSTQGAFAAWGDFQELNPIPKLSYLNPLPYFGIGENKTNFSLNPFTGFKNCNKCKVKKVKKCDECTKPRMTTCPNCQKAFAPCETYHQIYVAPPRCTSCDR